MTRNIWSVYTFLLLACTMLPCNAVDITSSHYANTFIETESVIAFTSSFAKVSLIDETGKLLLTRDGTGNLDFGKLSPGYYEAISEDAKLPIVVLIDPSKRVKGDSAVAVDNAMSWLVPEADFYSIAGILKLTGMSWVRERMKWSEVASSNGRFNFGKYTKSANALAKLGIKVCQVFHDSPNWARKDGLIQAAPDDLRVAYKFGNAFAKQFKGKVFALESWNEPDGSFFYYTSSECAALQKAIYLGVKSIDPSMRVLGSSIILSTPFDSDLLDNDAGWYMDVWNYHIYTSPEDYQARADHFRRVQANHGIKLPMWVTEAGDPFVDSPDGILSSDMQKHQARFISRAYAQGIAAGNERFFYFVFPFYREGTRGWGVFGPGNKYAFPGLAAMSTATYALGQAKYLGTVNSSRGPQRILVFDRGNGTACITAWQTLETPSMMTLPFTWSIVKDARDYLGRTIPRSEGPVKLELGDSASYFVVNLKDLHVEYLRPNSAPKLNKSGKPGLMQIVPRLVYPKSISYNTYSKNIDAYMIDTSRPVSLVAQVYNFDTKSVNGEVIFNGLENCDVTPKSINCSVLPGGIFSIPIVVKAKSRRDVAAVSMIVISNNKLSSRAVIKLTQDPELVHSLAGYNIESNKPEDWDSNIVPGAELKIESDPDSGVRLVSTFPPNVDRWTYPQTVKRTVMDLSKYDALQFEYKTGPNDKGLVRAQLVEEDGSYHILSSLPCSEEWRLATLLFKDSWQMDNGDKNLDLDKIVRIRIGANSETQSFTLCVRNLRAVRL